MISLQSKTTVESSNTGGGTGLNRESHAYSWLTFVTAKTYKTNSQGRKHTGHCLEETKRKLQRVLPVESHRAYLIPLASNTNKYEVL